LKKIIQNKIKNIAIKVVEKIKYSVKCDRQKVIIGGVVFLIVIFLAGVYYLPKRFEAYQLRTHFYKTTEKLNAITEEQANGDIGGQCDKIRNSAERLYTVDEISTEINNATNGEKIKLIGKSEDDAEIKPEEYLLLNIKNKDTELLCFNFNKRVVVEGNGKLEIGFGNFNDIEGNALSLLSGQGKVHHNQIINSSKTGIFATAGQWEIYGNIIKNNLSYGVYGGYEASLNLFENAISDNGGYEVRLLKDRKVFD